MFQPAEKAKRHWKVSLWGAMKSGKTWGALSFPKVAMIDTDRGSLPYSDKFHHNYIDANHWSELLDAVKWLEQNPGKFETLAIDSLTIFYQDLLDVQIDYIRNKRANEIMTYSDWGTVKRRWKSLMNRLMDLDMNVILCSRQKDEYETYIDPRTGEDKSKKTGEVTPDAEKSVNYFFDVILHVYTEEDRKSKKSKYFVRVDGTRYQEQIPKYSVYDISGKSLFGEIFQKLDKEVQSGAVLAPRLHTGEPQKEAPRQEAPVVHNEPTRIGELVDFAERIVGGDPDAPKATVEDIKVLMTRANQMTWPDGSTFTSAQGKNMIYGFFSVETSKDLKKHQADFLYNEFGEVLAGRAELALDERGIPFVHRLNTVEVCETKGERV